MKIKRITVCVLMCMLIFSITGFAERPEYKVQIFFSPGIMNDINGEVAVDINLRNVDLSIPETLGSICGLEFSYEYDTAQFDVLTDESGDAVIETDENTLVHSNESISVKTDKERGRISIAFEDGTLEKNLIDFDGTLCRFTLVANNVNEIWNSFDYYPIRFVEGSVKVSTYNGIVLNPYYAVEGIDGKIGAYNTPPTLEASLDKTIIFNLGSTDIKVDNKIVATDAASFIQNGVWMIPVRYLSENIGMDVEWDGETASAYGKYKTLKIALKKNKVYINSAICETDIKPVEINGRIFIPVSVVSELYPNSEINKTDTELLIYIP